jgi:hypothetical protein
MTERRRILSKLTVGDIFHASGSAGASLICLIVEVTASSIKARRVTTQEDLEFDRETGLERCHNETASEIDSVAPLPPDILNTVLGIDRKFRLLQDPEQAKLTDTEIKVLGTYLGPYYASNPL